AKIGRAGVDDMERRIQALEGRIIAQEILGRIVLSAVANGQGQNPVEVIDRIRRETFATLQNAQRDVGDHADAIWEQAVEAMETEFAAVRARLSDQ
ncbi:MAG: hypothetical protein ACLGIM_19465, partial [Alphaproteobacteria bacterium]